MIQDYDPRIQQVFFEIKKAISGKDSIIEKIF